MSCDASWDFDVDFTAACLRTDTHTRHRAEVTGNDGIVAVIEWPADPDTCPACGKSRTLDAGEFTYVEVRTLCDPEPELTPTHDCRPPDPTDPTDLRVRLYERVTYIDFEEDQ